MTGQTERNQQITTLDAGALLDYVQSRKVGGWRLVVMIANQADKEVELIYVFEKDNELTNVRVVLPAEAPRVPSISLLYGYSFVYENEIHDLFGVKFEGLQLDFGGNYFVTALKTPWNPLAKGEEFAADAVVDDTTAVVADGEAAEEASDDAIQAEVPELGADAPANASIDAVADAAQEGGQD